MVDLTWLEGLLPIGLTPSALNGSEMEELDKRRSLAPTLNKKENVMVNPTGKAGLAMAAWRTAADAATKLSPGLIASAQALVKKAAPGSTLTGLLGGASLDGRKLAVELMAKAGYDMNKVDTVFHAFGVPERAEVMSQVQSFLLKEVVAAETTKVSVVRTKAEDTILFDQINKMRERTGLRSVDELQLLSSVMNQLTAETVLAYKTDAILSPKLLHL